MVRPDQLRTRARFLRCALLWGCQSTADRVPALPGLRLSSCPGGGLPLRLQVVSLLGLWLRRPYPLPV